MKDYAKGDLGKGQKKPLRGSRPTGKMSGNAGMHLKSHGSPQFSGASRPSIKGALEHQQFHSLAEHHMGPPEGYQGGVDSENADCDD